MALVPFAPWEPDKFALNAAGVSGEANGIFPAPDSRTPWPSLATTSLAAAATVRGAFAARTSDGSIVVFIGTATKLYKFAGVASPWTDVSRSVGGNYTGTGLWSFAQFDKYVIACNGADANQYIDIDSGTNFAALPGSPPIARYVKTVGDFVMLMDLASPLGIASSGRIQVAWSGVRDFDFWTFGQKSSGFATFWDGGFVQGCTSILGGLMFQKEAISRMVRRQQGLPAFDFAPILETQGTNAPASIISHEGETSFLSSDGFMTIGSDGIRQIGFGRVDKWFLENCEPTRVSEVIGALDPVTMREMWAFPTAGNTSSLFDHIICHDKRLDEWTHAPVSTSYLFAAASPGVTLEGLDALYATLEDVPYSLDSPIWAGGAPGLFAFDGSNKMATFSGPNLAAIMQTALLQPVPGRRAFCNGFRSIGDAANATGRVAVTERSQTAQTWLGSRSMVPGSDLIPARASARYMRFEKAIAAGESWTHEQGIDFGDPGEELVTEDGER